MNLIFIEAGIKISTQYYTEKCELLMLSLICNIAGDVFVFHQNIAPTHCAHDTVELSGFCAMRHPIY